MKTKAVRIHGKMDLRLEEIELPQVGPDDVQVKIISDSICMSTYKAAVEGEEHKRVPNDVAEHPTIVGHEFCGVITEVGENWKNKYKPGQGFAIQPAHFYKGSQMAPGYSYQYCGVLQHPHRDAADRQPAAVQFRYLLLWLPGRADELHHRYLPRYVPHQARLL